MNPVPFSVRRVIRESTDSFTLILEGYLRSKPGQFVMLWLPGVDEKPFAVAYQNDGEVAITIEKKGNATRAMSELKKGDKVGIRGPFGHGFTPRDNSIIVAGGLGIASVLDLAMTVRNSILIQGARTGDLLLYRETKELLERIECMKNKILYCTDDGSVGEKAFTTSVLCNLIKEKKPDIVYACGPEIMMLKTFEICEQNKIDCEISIERFMKCGIGLCGSCVINDQLVCKDGPVFNNEKVRKLTELGKFARLPTGKKVELKEYYAYHS